MKIKKFKLTCFIYLNFPLYINGQDPGKIGGQDDGGDGKIGVGNLGNGGGNEETDHQPEVKEPNGRLVVEVVAFGD